MIGSAWMIAAYAIVLVIAPAARPSFIRDRVATIPLAVFAHLSASAVALAVGPFQFVDRWRARHLALHRWTGRMYLAGILIGGMAGFRLAIVSQGGVVAHFGFAALASVWIATALCALLRVLTGNTVDHRRWMIRNYSLTLAAVTLRIYLPVSLVAGLPFELAYPAISWLCWVPNLIVAERWVRRRAAVGGVPNALSTV